MIRFGAHVYYECDGADCFTSKKMSNGNNDDTWDLTRADPVVTGAMDEMVKKRQMVAMERIGDDETSES